MIMTAHPINVPVTGLEGVKTPDWMKRIGVAASETWASMGAGFSASRDYRALTARGVSPQQATRMVFEKHFSKM
jgi:hypothetical protein